MHKTVGPRVIEPNVFVKVACGGSDAEPPEHEYLDDGFQDDGHVERILDRAGR